LVRSFLRYLRERVGEEGFEAVGRELAGPPAELLHHPVGRLDWIPLGTWLPVLEAFERWFGDLPTWRLLREMTRATTAVAVAKGWSAFMADLTPDLLLQRSGTFWHMSYNTGQLVVLQRGSRHCLLAIEGWQSPPASVVASVAESCVVFLVRLGERTGRAVDRVVSGRAEIDVTW
jgi:hypothetical protein